MLTTLLLGFVLLALVITAMAIGVIMGKRPINGSCGGIGAALGEKDYTCDICGDDPNKCEEINNNADSDKANALSYDATTRK